MLNYGYPASLIDAATASRSAQRGISSLSALMKRSDLLKPEQILDSGQNKSTSLRSRQLAVPAPTDGGQRGQASSLLRQKNNGLLGSALALGRGWIPQKSKTRRRLAPAEADL